MRTVCCKFELWLQLAVWRLCTADTMQWHLASRVIAACILESLAAVLQCLPTMSSCESVTYMSAGFSSLLQVTDDADNSTAAGHGAGHGGEGDSSDTVEDLMSQLNALH